jgi:hypothetical protein
MFVFVVLEVIDSANNENPLWAVFWPFTVLLFGLIAFGNVLGYFGRKLAKTIRNHLNVK